jgi:Zn-dependent peptidase ImmA (M78 family)
VAGLDTNRGAKRAREARARLGVDPAAPLACVLSLVEDAAGLPVVVAALPQDVAGASWRRGNSAVLWVNGEQPPVRQRFTLAHEFGHVCCGHEGAAVDTPATLAGRSQDSREVQANAFAAELLMPRAGIAAMLRGDPGLDDVVRVAALHGVSTIAALYRCRTLGLLTWSRFERLRREIEHGLHREVWQHLGLEPLEDALSAIEEHPRLPPALEGSALAALLRGEASVSAAAAAAGCFAPTLGEAAAALGR